MTHPVFKASTLPTSQFLQEANVFLREATENRELFRIFASEKAPTPGPRPSATSARGFHRRTENEKIMNNDTNLPHNGDTEKAPWHFPAEWAEQELVQLTWPHAGTDWLPTLDDITKTYVKMAINIARHERLLIVAPRPEEALEAIRQYATDAEMRNISTLACPTDDTWARDHGFLSLLSGDGSRRRLLDFCFNGWGEKFAAAQDNAINGQLHRAGCIGGDYEEHLDFVLEGGSVESDGKGTVFTTTGCLMAPHRNQPLTQADIEERLKLWLHAERVVWIDHGNLVGDDTDGHIDTLVRTAPDDTLLYVASDDPTDEQYAELKRMEEQLQTFRTLQGKPYRLLRLPMPRPIFHDGERLPATYANFLVVNGAVLCPIYGQADLDFQALRTIAKAFPGREIVGIDCRSIVVQHGSLHCCTMQYPTIVASAKGKTVGEEKPKKEATPLLSKLREEKAMQLRGGIYHKVQVDMAYNSNHMEGSQLTHDQTRYIYETNTIGLTGEAVRVDDIVETVNHFRCLDFVVDHADERLTESLIKRLHALLKGGTSDSRKEWFAVGKYKRLPNEVGGLQTCPPKQVHKEMVSLLETYNATENKTLQTLLDFHASFERIHPFQDGNGRVGRLILFKECLAQGIVPFVITDELKMFYYRGLKEWGHVDGYLTDTCLSAQDDFKAALDYFKITY